MASVSVREGPMSARGGASFGSKRLKANMGPPRNNDFLKLVERTEDAFVTSEDSAVEDVRRILSDVRQLYDNVHNEAEKKEAELTKLREAIHLTDSSHGARADEVARQEELRTSLEKQHAETLKAIHDAKTSEKVYNHMLSRITKEQAILKEKMLLMQAHLGRKGQEAMRKMSQQERLIRKGAESSQELEQMEAEVEQERMVREEAHKGMLNALQAKMDARERRARFEEWRHEVALDAANEAFNASAGRLRKLYAIEKLAGNCLQKITFEQVERSQTTEDGFQRIREVTGLNDVMDIVHKFLNRDVEHEQLKSSVKEAEVRLENLREQFDKNKRDTDGITFDPDAAGRTRQIYLEVEEHEAMLNQSLKEHEQSRTRLQKSTLQVEHMKRWANRMGRALQAFEECARIEKPADLPVYFQQMHRAVDKFVAHIVQQISTGKVQRKNMAQVASKEYHEASRLLADKDFIKANCRVPASADNRPSSRQGQGKDLDEDSAETHQNDRDRCKTESKEKLYEATRKLEAQKKKSVAAK
eukprot:gnl/TRDRNA2_/TRDRNA2_181125_c0_seq1.p1 gnl/TRDRNA2_/TRDRNA2_181125_c0~~gnl/TRDRNA2_/TRDRNA2_181125_c0_seq1.p1  ORF type:complete len:531 (+),score=158.52 gnl/TRDRNA2_/TRDRNA2_181125_c0_seq1:86-1678(+)